MRAKQIVAARAASQERKWEQEQQQQPLVYCGPTVRNVARRDTVFSNGVLPKGLQNFIVRNPEAGGLVVELDRFAQVRRSIETAGTAENILFQLIQEKV